MPSPRLPKDHRPVFSLIEEEDDFYYVEVDEEEQVEK